jgi:hypothetical protein
MPPPLVSTVYLSIAKLPLEPVDAKVYDPPGSNRGGMADATTVERL